MRSGPLLRVMALAGAGLGLAVGEPAKNDLTGTWIGTIPEQGRTAAQEVAIKLIQVGEELQGKVYNDRGASDSITAGRVFDNKVEFFVELMEQSGNQVNLVVYRYSGPIDAETISITRERASARNSVSGAPIPVRRPTETDEQDRARRFRTFRLEQLY